MGCLIAGVASLSLHEEYGIHCRYVHIDYTAHVIAKWIHYSAMNSQFFVNCRAVYSSIYHAVNCSPDDTHVTLQN